MSPDEFPGGSEDTSEAEGAREILPTDDIIRRGIELINSILRPQISSLLGVALEGEDKEQIKKNAFEAQHCTDIEALTRRVAETIMAVIAADCFSAAEEKGWSFRWNQGYEQIAREATAQWLANPNEDISTIVERLLTPLRADYELLPKLKDLLAGYIIQVRETRHLLARVQQLYTLGGIYTPLPARNVTSKRLLHPEDADKVLDARNSVLIVDDVFDALEKLQSGDPRKYIELQPIIGLGGGLLFRRSKQEIENRIARPDQWVIATAEGEGDQLIQPGASTAKGSAFIHIRYVSPRERSPIIALPGPQDTFRGGRYFVDWARRNPTHIAVVDDFYVEKPMAHRRVASAARSRGFHILQNDINPQRSSFDRIEIVFAEIFSSINGWWIGDEYFPLPKTNPLNGEQLSRFSNYSSQLAHLGSRNFPADAAWERRERRSPIYLQDDDLEQPTRRSLDITWLVTAQVLRR